MKKLLSVRGVLVIIVCTALYFNIGHIFASTWNTVCQNGGEARTVFQTIVTVSGDMTPFCKPNSYVGGSRAGMITDQTFFMHVVVWPITSVIIPALVWAVELIFLGGFVKLIGLV